MTESKEIQKPAFEHFKNIFKMLSQKQYKESLNELVAFLKAVCASLKEFYVKYLKGQHVVVKGKRIPRTAIAILCVLILYLISPMSCLFSGEPAEEEGETDIVFYDKNNIKISNLKKCDIAACGELEYTGKEEIDVVRIIISFFTKSGEKIHDSYVDAPKLEPDTRVEFSVPAEKKFGYFKVSDVQINPTEEPDEYEEEEEEEE